MTALHSMLPAGTDGDQGSQAVVNYLYKRNALHHAMVLENGQWYVVKKGMVLEAIKILFGK